MDSPSSPSVRRTVLVAVSLDGASIVALMRASFLARQFGDELRVLHVVLGAGEISPLQVEASARIVMNWARDAGIVVPRECIEIRSGSPDVEIARSVAAAAPRLVVIGGLAAGDSALPGHVARFVARNVQMPVMVTAPPSPSRRIVAASDLRDDRYPVLSAAAALAIALGARATAVHNAGPPTLDTAERSERLQRGIARSACFAEALVTREPTTSDAITSIARLVDADVVVVGIRPGRGETFASLLHSERRTMLAVPIPA